MGLFEKLFGTGKQDKALRGYFQTLTAYQPVFYSRGGGIYEAMETRAAIHAIATHCSKLKPHVNGPQAARLERRLELQMNPWQNTQQFLYRSATILEVENACFLIPVEAENGKTIGAYPIVPSSCELAEGPGGALYLRYRFPNGQHAAMEYDRCGVLITGFTFLLEIERAAGGEPVSNPDGIKSNIVLMSDGAIGYASTAGFRLYAASRSYIISGWMGNGYYKYNGNCYLPGTNRFVWWHDPGTSYAFVTVNGLITVQSKAASYQSKTSTIVLNSYSYFEIKEFVCYKRALTSDERSAYLADGTMP